MNVCRFYFDFFQIIQTLMLVKKKRGRPSKADLEARALLYPDGYPFRVTKRRKHKKKRFRPVDPNNPLSFRVERETTDIIEALEKLYTSDTPDEEFKLNIEVDSLFMGDWIVLDCFRVPGYENIKELNYFVCDGVDTKGVLRCVPMESITSILNELQFLDKMERNNCSHLFDTVLDVKLIDSDPRFAYLITEKRPGNNLPDYLTVGERPDGSYDEFLTFNPDFIYTRTRFAMDMLAIVETVCKAGFVLRNLAIEHFAFDEVARRVYLADRRNIVVGFERQALPHRVIEGVSMSWIGNVEHAPLSWHQDEESPMTECDCLESLFYVLLDMYGILTWKDLTSRMISINKNRWMTADPESLLQSPTKLPSPLITYWLELRRGRMVDVSRVPTLAHGSLLRPKNKTDPIEPLNTDKHLRKKTPYEKIIPTSSMLDYKVLHGTFLSMCRTICHMNNDWAKPLMFDSPATDSIMVRVACEHNRLLTELDELVGEVVGLQTEKHCRDRDERQNDVELAQNEIFIEKYIKGTGTVIKKEEPIDEDY